MTISVGYSVICQGRGHRCSGFTGLCDTKREALNEAKRIGFKRVRVQNGSMWDFCHSCYLKYKAGEI